MRRPSITLKAGLIAGFLGALAGPARAEPGLGFDLDCPMLSAEQRASLEARATADLAMKQIYSGELRFDCTPPDVTATYAPVGGATRSERARLDSDPASWVEQMLSLSNAITRDDAESSEVPEPPAPPPLAMASPTPSRPRARQRPAPPRTSPPPKATAREPLRIEAGIGLRAELWGSERPALFGPSLALGVRPQNSLRIDLSMSAAWGTETRDIGLSQWRGAIDVVLGRNIWIAAGAGLSGFRYTAEGASPDARWDFEPALGLRSGGALTFSRQSLWAGVGLAVYPRARDIQIDDDPVFRTPFFSFVASVEYRLSE